ncbi:hypothetical protein [Micropruina sp.]|uniref:hypothetical protein n=1 Tax=Micropruina sp. TaxID=2737536 RepID=UPI0039E510DB
MRARWTALLAAVSALALLASGCTTHSDVPEATAVGSADLAVYITEFTNGVPASGRVVLYDHTGPIAMVNNSGIRVPDMIWDQHGLFFLDMTTTYQLSDHLEQQVREQRNGRPDDTLVSMTGNGNGSRLVLFNDGLWDGHNHFGIGLFDGTHETSHAVLLDSLGGAVSWCANSFWLATELGGGDMRDRSAFFRLTNGPIAAPQQLGTTRTGVTLDSRNTPCHSDRIITLTYPTAADNQPLEIWQTQLSDGSVTRTPLIDQHHKPIRLPLNAHRSSSTAPRWLDGNTLVWIDNLGVAHRSDLTTGITTTIRDGMIANVAPTRNWVRTGNWLVAYEPLPDRTGTLHIYSIDNNLTQVETRTLPKLADLTPSDQRVMAIAISPTFTPHNP